MFPEPHIIASILFFALFICLFFANVNVSNSDK
jgi:hypothetical protein